MDEYIERGALMQFPIRRNHYDRKNGNKHFINGIESVLEYAENLPAADVAPVVHAHWQPYEDTVQCSACGFGTFMDGYFFVHGECTHADDRSFRFSFCPNCGAKMDETVGNSDRLEENKE